MMKMILMFITGLVLIPAGRSASECPGEVYFDTVMDPNLNDRKFFRKVAGVTVADCARACRRTSQFCFSAVYDPETSEDKRCALSYREGKQCPKGRKLMNTFDRRDRPVLIECIRCPDVGEMMTGDAMELIRNGSMSATGHMDHGDGDGMRSSRSRASDVPAGNVSKLTSEALESTKISQVSPIVSNSELIGETRGTINESTSAKMNGSNATLELAGAEHTNTNDTSEAVNTEEVPVAVAAPFAVATPSLEAAPLLIAAAPPIGEAPPLEAFSLPARKHAPRGGSTANTVGDIYCDSELKTCKQCSQHPSGSCSLQVATFHSPIACASACSLDAVEELTYFYCNGRVCTKCVGDECPFERWKNVENCKLDCGKFWCNKGKCSRCSHKDKKCGKGKRIHYTVDKCRRNCVPEEGYYICKNKQCEKCEGSECRGKTPYDTEFDCESYCGLYICHDGECPSCDKDPRKCPLGKLLTTNHTECKLACVVPDKVTYYYCKDNKCKECNRSHCPKEVHRSKQDCDISCGGQLSQYYCNLDSRKCESCQGSSCPQNVPRLLSEKSCNTFCSSYEDGDLGYFCVDRKCLPCRADIECDDVSDNPICIALEKCPEKDKFTSLTTCSESCEIGATVPPKPATADSCGYREVWNQCMLCNPSCEDLEKGHCPQPCACMCRPPYVRKKNTSNADCIEPKECPQYIQKGKRDEIIDDDTKFVCRGRKCVECDKDCPEDSHLELDLCLASCKEEADDRKGYFCNDNNKCIKCGKEVRQRCPAATLETKKLCMKECPKDGATIEPEIPNLRGSFWCDGSGFCHPCLNGNKCPANSRSFEDYRTCRKECTITKEECKQNSIWNECIKCQKTCEDPDGHLCYRYFNGTPPCTPACDCKIGYVYSQSEQSCVSVTQCPSCGLGEEYRDCSSPCQPTCTDPSPSCPHLTECSSGCFCHDGLFRTGDGRCVHTYDC